MKFDKRQDPADPVWVTVVTPEGKHEFSAKESTSLDELMQRVRDSYPVISRVEITVTI